jgi:hypothetical protein
MGVMNMKKILALGIIVLVFFIALTGCDEDDYEIFPTNNLVTNSQENDNLLAVTEGNISFTAANVRKIEVFTGAVPAQAVKKTVTNEADIIKIITALNALNIEREATDDDMLAGGIGTTFHFYLSNEGSYTIRNHGNLLHTSNGLFVVKGTSLNTDDFWKSLYYDETRVNHDELPVIGTANFESDDYDDTAVEQYSVSFEEGNVTLLSNGEVYEAGIYFLHGARQTDDGGLISASPIPFEFWLAHNLERLPIIQYNESLHVVTDGEFGRIAPNRVQQDSWYHGEIRIVELIADDFIDGIANVYLPNEAGVYLVCVTVTWTGGGDEFTALRYVFKIVK